MKQLFWQLKKAYGLIFHYPVSRIESRGVDYDAYWRDKRPGTIGLLSEWQKQRADLALRYVGDGVESIADIGSGDGAMLKYIRENSAVKKGIAVDVSDVVLEQASKFGFETIKADINKVEDRKKIPEADYIFMFEILEHIPDSEEFLRLMLQKSKKGVLFSFPNTGFLVHRLRLLFGKFPLQWRVHPGEHLRFWTYKDLRWWLKAQGYSGYTIHTYRGVSLLNRLWPSLFAAAFFVYLPKGET